MIAWALAALLTRLLGPLDRAAAVWAADEIEVDRSRIELTANCDGFRWIGQSFASCDNCGQPYWEHTHIERIRAGTGPFDDDPFEYVRISDEQKAAYKASTS